MSELVQPEVEMLEPVPPEIKKWNWGAFLFGFVRLGWVWAFGNRVWGIAALSILVSLLLFFVPLINLILAIVLGVKGNEWAWRSKHWDSVEHFQRTQRKWARAGVIVVSLILLLVALAILLAVIVGQRNSGGDSGKIFEDGFSSTSSGWATKHDSTHTIDYTNGGYRMYNSADKGAFVSVAPVSADKVEDASVEVDVTKATSSGKSGAWGVSCRYDPDKKNAYLLGISDKGQPLIVKFKGEESALIAKGNPNDIGNPTSNHRIRGDCVGNNFALYVDGNKLIDGSDDELSSGKVGLFVDSGQDVSFDNFSASKP